MNEINYTEPTLDNQKEFLDNLDLLVDTIYIQFKATKIYLKILSIDENRKENSVKSFNYEEQKLLEREIHTHFPIFMNKLKKFCTTLTKTERLICCLSLRFHPHTVCLCMGYNNTLTFKTHKHNIKKKMVELSGNQFLFDFIFKPATN
ncbi:MAG: hypothetical protein LBJ17_08240 [Dysgonamonadaceae bacterium]|nr:hypothetical protein [Dysgonamonadaceae bacterium]